MEYWKRIAKDHPAKPGPYYGQTCAQAHGVGYCCEKGHYDANGQCLGYPDELTCRWEPQYKTCPYQIRDLQGSKTVSQDHPARPGPQYGQTCAQAHGVGYCCEE